jgi:hypothetical protein
MANCKLLALVTTVVMLLLVVTLLGVPTTRVDIRLEGDRSPLNALEAISTNVVEEPTLVRHVASEPMTATTAAPHEDRLDAVSCSRGELPPPVPHFQQVLTFVGPVLIADIAGQLNRLCSVSPVIPNTNGQLRVVFFALDGTLLNLMRWGRIVNDNDIDMGFYIVEADGHRMPVNHTNPLEHYHILQTWLFSSGLMGRPITDRDVRKLHDSKKVLKPHVCKHRGQMMQCRMDSTPVLLDWFGVESLEAPLTGLSDRDVIPTVPCKCFGRTFPCPAQPMRTLKHFTLNVGSWSDPIAHREFEGCALFPRRTSEQTKAHITSIVAYGEWLRKCGFPNLLQELDTHSQHHEVHCETILKKL